MKSNKTHTLFPKTPNAASKGAKPRAEVSRGILDGLMNLAANTSQGTFEDLRLAHFGDFGIIGDGDHELIRILTDDQGNIRSLIAQPGVRLSRDPLNLSDHPAQYVSQFLDQEPVRKSLKLNNVSLKSSDVSDMGVNGQQVKYQQVIRTKCTEDGCLTDIEIPVYKGLLFASLSAQGDLVNVTSTIAHGRKPDRLGKLIGAEAAVAAARKRFGQRPQLASNELMMTELDGSFEPVYVITLRKLQGTKNSNPSVKEILVNARTGRIEEWHERLRFNQHSPVQDLVLNSPVGSVLHKIPDPSDDIANIASTEFFEGLPDPSVMSNQYFEVFTLQSGPASKGKGSSKKRSFVKGNKSIQSASHAQGPKRWTNLKANADGNFVFKVGTDGFCASIDFYALTKEMELCARLGLKQVTLSVPVHVNDPTNEDNAWLDPTSPLMSIGEGTGLKRGGLIKYIAYDIGVCWHECGHWIVTIQTPSQDLTGDEGAPMHEAIGDIMTVIMNCMFRLWYAKKIGMNFTKKDLQTDGFDIGGYAAQPGVIRYGRNTKQTPQDKTGEPHDDSEIVTGALVDFFTDFVLAYPGDDLIEPIETFLRVILYALANMPARDQKFTDLLQALITAVQNCTQGRIDAKLVEAAFKKHSIVLGGAGTVKKRRRRSPKPKMDVAA